MSIGKVGNYVTLVNEINPAIIKSVKVCKGTINSESYTVTISEWGDDLYPWIEGLFSSDGKSDRYMLNGLKDSAIVFERQDTGLPFRLFFAHVGDRNVSSSSDSFFTTIIFPMETATYEFTRRQYASFRGVGFYIVYDDSHIADRPRYAFITTPLLDPPSTGIMQQYKPIPYVFNWKTLAGRKEGSVYYPYNNDKAYSNKIYENYAGTDYDPAKAKEEEIFGFPIAPDHSGESVSKGGQGDMDDTSTPILIDAAREVFVGNFFRIYALNTVNLSLLSNFLLSADFIDNIKKLYSNPMDYLINLSAMPVSTFNGTTENVRIGNITSEDVSGKRLTNFFVDVDCGEISLTEYFGAFLDYSPYTSITLYAPFCGYTSLNVDSFQNDAIKIRYRVDAMTGQCVCMISNSQGLITTLSGNVAYQIPMRSADFSALFTGLCSTALNVVGGVAAGSPLSVMSGVQNFLASAPTKPSITNTGSLSSNAGTMTNKKPYIIIERPSISVPKNYGHEIGYNSYIYRKLSDTHGFTKVLSIHLDNTTATREEKSELEALLRNGVVLP